MALWLSPDPLILASRSKVRQKLLAAAGIPIEVCPADLDERQLEALSPSQQSGAVATFLASEKALSVEVSSPGALCSAPISCWRWMASAFPSRATAQPRAHNCSNF